MRGHQGVWLAGPDGVMAAEVDRYRLVVRTPEHAGGPVRFLVLRRARDEGSHGLIGSGTEPDVRTAKEKATRMAGRLMERPRLPNAV
jgi:hypothetical protein